MCGNNYRKSYLMAAKCIECEDLADHHDLCRRCHEWYRKRLENVTIEKVEEMPETEEEVFYVHCRKCGDASLCASKEHKEKLEQRNEEPLKGRSLYTCRACIYSWL